MRSESTKIRSTDLKIYSKADDLYEWCCPIILGFPLAEKFALSQDIRNAFYSLLQTIVLANEIFHKRRMYQSEIDAHLSLVVVLFNIARRRGYVTENKNHSIQNRIAEIGAMLGGWQKVTR